MDTWLGCPTTPTRTGYYSRCTRRTWLGCPTTPTRTCSVHLPKTVYSESGNHEEFQKLPTRVFLFCCNHLDHRHVFLRRRGGGGGGNWYIIYTEYHQMFTMYKCDKTVGASVIIAFCFVHQFQWIKLRTYLRTSLILFWFLAVLFSDAMVFLLWYGEDVIELIKR